MKKLTRILFIFSTLLAFVLAENVQEGIIWEKGVYLAPSQFEVCFLSLAHSDEDIEKTITAAKDALAAL